MYIHLSRFITAFIFMSVWKNFSALQEGIDADEDFEYCEDYGTVTN